MNEAYTATGEERGRSRDRTRERIILAATRLLAESGSDALTTRAVAAAAEVQAPTLYRLFGDKEGLLDALAEHGFARYLTTKGVRTSGTDPVEDLRAGWDSHLDFGLSNPALYLLMYANPRPDRKSPAATAAYDILQTLVHQIAQAGRLRIKEEHAVNLVHASACGLVLTLLGMAENRRDQRLSDLARDSVIASITTDSPAVAIPAYAPAAMALRATLPHNTSLSNGERSLLAEWLDRLAGPEQERTTSISDDTIVEPK